MTHEFWDREMWGLFCSCAPVATVLEMWREGFASGFLGGLAAGTFACGWWLLRRRAWKEAKEAGPDA